MAFYKIIKDDRVIGIGSAFLKWNLKYREFWYCDSEDSPECVQNVLTSDIYHPSWLIEPPASANGYSTEATVIGIESNEYFDLKALLEEGEEVPSPEPLTPDSSDEESHEEESQDIPMTLSEMRAKIKEQESRLDENDDLMAELLFEITMMKLEGSDE